MKFELIIFLCLMYCNCMLPGQSCVIVDENRLTKTLATKTPYEYVRANNTLFSFPEQCYPSKFWLISRHGTRYPSRKGIEAIQYVLPEILKSVDLLQSVLCENDIELLNSWKPEVKAQTKLFALPF